MFLKILILLFTVLVSQTFAAEKISEQMTNLYGKTFSYSIPPWSSGDMDKIMDESKFSRQQQGPMFMLEAVPAAESFESWKTIFSIRAAQSSKIPLQQWVNMSLKSFMDYCESPEFVTLKEDKKSQTIKVVCPKVIGLSLFGYDEGVGEIGVFRFLKDDDVLVSHYIEWRGRAFDKTDEKTWPVSQDKIQDGIAIIERSKLF